MIEQLGIISNWQTVTLAEFPTLKEQDLHLWWLPLSITDEQKNTALYLLSDIQRDKYHRRATQELKDAYLAGRYYLLTLLAAYANSAPDQIELSYSRFNKPSLSHKDHNIEFNFTDTSTNSAAYGLFAFSKNRAVGVDLEARTRRSNFKAIAHRRFSQEEIDYVTATNSQIDPERFLAIWTRKEAYGKATGLGINYTMRDHNLMNSRNHHHLDFTDHNNDDWRLMQIQPDDNFIAAVVHSGTQSLSVKTFNSLNQTP